MFAIRNIKTVGIAIAALIAYAAPATAEPNRLQFEPEGASGWFSQPVARASRHMISTASVQASEAGRDMLRAGGSAIDAAIAAQLVLGLVEPQSSGIGGGAFLVHWDAKQNSLTALDGRETAPATAKPDRFLKDGAPLPFVTAVRSGLSIGTPGVVRLLEEAHKAHGKLPWAKLFEPAIRLAEDGFEVSTRLHTLLRFQGRDGFSPAARTYFFTEQGSALPHGHLLKNPAYAATLKAIAGNGGGAFYSGAIAEAIVAAVRDAPNVSGDLSAADLAAYSVKSRSTVCAPYRTTKVCSIGPPSSGGVAIAQILTLLEPFDLGTTPLSPRAVHLVAEAEKLAYADRDRYLADPDFISVPAGLTDPSYLGERRKLINPDSAMAKPKPGDPPGQIKGAFGHDATLERAGTSHISIIDGDGNVVSMTTTIEGVFGSGVMAAGFLLNNELTDFSFKPTDAEGQPIANRVEGGKRPRSTMTPTIVFDAGGKPFAALGSPGGGRIIFYVAKALISLIDWKLDAQAASALTNFGSMGGAVEIESGWQAILLGLRLKTYGHTIKPDLMTSGVHIVLHRNGGLEGGADPRREGAALGD